ncbi:MAG: acyl-CoA dehydrogenase family protein [Acidobacteriaceae bacterium]
MNFDFSPKSADLQVRLLRFFVEHIYPNEHAFTEQVEANRRTGNPWQIVPLMEELKVKARAAGLWNLFLPHSDRAPEGLSNLDYAPLCEIMGRVHWAPEVFNCSAPDTGNMETLELYGTEAQKDAWLDPLLRGEIRSSFVMTEPDVASSDATNVQTSIVRDGGYYVINGSKSWISGAGDTRTRIYIVMGKTDPEAARHLQQSMILVPANTPGVTVTRPLRVLGFDHAPSGHMALELVNVRVPVENLLLGEGRGFEIAQGRLGPGRIHHCMRCIGVAERALELLVRRAKSRVAFGRPLSEQGVWRERIAEARISIEQARLLVFKTAYMMDTVGNKKARSEIAMIKVLAPNVSSRIVDWAIQMYGATGLCDDTPLAEMYALQRAIRFTDGPDEVHRNVIAKLELARYDD